MLSIYLNKSSPHFGGCRCNGWWGWGWVCSSGLRQKTTTTTKNHLITLTQFLQYSVTSFRKALRWPIKYMHECTQGIRASLSCSIVLICCLPRGCQDREQTCFQWKLCLQNVILKKTYKYCVCVATASSFLVLASNAITSGYWRIFKTFLTSCWPRHEGDKKPTGMIWPWIIFFLLYHIYFLYSLYLLASSERQKASITDWQWDSTVNYLSLELSTINL